MKNKLLLVGSEWLDKDTMSVRMFNGEKISDNMVFLTLY